MGLVRRKIYRFYKEVNSIVLWRYSDCIFTLTSTNKIHCHCNFNKTAYEQRQLINGGHTV